MDGLGATGTHGGVSESLPFTSSTVDDFLAQFLRANDLACEEVVANATSLGPTRITL